MTKHNPKNGNSRSQDHPTIYRPNGELYGSWTHKLKHNKIIMWVEQKVTLF